MDGELFFKIWLIVCVLLALAVVVLNTVAALIRIGAL